MLCALLSPSIYRYSYTPSPVTQLTFRPGPQVSYIIVDEMHEDHPELVRDQYWEDVIPAELPYTVAAEQYRREPPQGSAAQIDVSEGGGA